MIAERQSRLGTETAFEVLSKARALEQQGKRVVHLEIGEPDFDTPDHIKEAAVKALYDGFTHYGPAQGMPVLREACAEYLAASRGVDYGPDDIVITPGAKPILFFTILAAVNPGDEVIYPDPGFPIYESMVNYVGGTPVPLRLREENDFRLDVEELASLVNDRTRLVILNYPHNPTGGTLTEKDLEGIAEAVDGRDIMVLCDEVYCRILYDGEFRSLASLPGMKDRVILVDGFSKTYAMTGWRLGFAAANREMIRQFTRLMVNSNSCTASFVQVAGAAALRGPQDSVSRMVAEFRRRRDFVVRELNRLPGVTCRMPQGAFYAFPNTAQTGIPCREIANLLLYEGGVAVLAGTCFGAGGEGYLRISYANSMENLGDALDRMRAVLAAHRREGCV